LNLVHVVPHIDQEAAGPSYSVPRLCQSLATLGNSVELSCLAARADIPGVALDLHDEWSILKRFAVSPSHATALRRKATQVDVVHNHSLWSMVNVAAGWVVPGQRAKLVTSPRGTLSHWALSRNNHVKRLLWPLQRRALTRADMLHATSQVEYQEIRAAGFIAPVAIIPNGIDLPTTRLVGSAFLPAQRTVLFLSRIHPTKGLDRLLHAWAELESPHPKWRLVIAGRGEAAHVKEVSTLAASLGLNRVEFPGPLYGQAKTHAYFGADLFVLPTHSENFGMVVAEALAHGCPTVVSRGAPWMGLETENCGWWVENDVKTLRATLDDAMKLSADHLNQMGLRGRAWMERDFGWASVGMRMQAAYRWVVEGGERPLWVRID
jgi:glycosyltransferase involved in cell wall biosynthesis